MRPSRALCPRGASSAAQCWSFPSSLIRLRKETSMSPSPQRNRSAFGIVELLVVVAIIAFLMALLLPAVQRAREQAAAQRTVNKLKEMALATHSCNDVYRRLPPAFDKFGIFMFPAAYHVHILPYLEQDALYKAFNMQKGGGDLKEVVVITFSSVEDPSSADKKVPGIQNFPVNLRIVSDEGFHKGIDAKSTPQNPLFQPIKVAAVMSGSANIPRTFIDGSRTPSCSRPSSAPAAKAA